MIVLDPREQAVADRIRELMTKQNLSLRGLAEKAGIHPATLSTFLRGQNSPRYAMVEQIADALGVSIDLLRSQPSAV